jgi:hypothetical protein
MPDEDPYDLLSEALDWARQQKAEYTAQLADQHSGLTVVQKQRLEYANSMLQTFISHHGNREEKDAQGS